MLYGSECWPLNKDHERQFYSAEMRMLRWACGWTRLDRVRNEDVRAVMQTAPVQLKMREQRLLVLSPYIIHYAGAAVPVEEGVEILLELL
ncbi:hypothetical protein TELCIR_00009 [Teladorsagia circumcincta]|uniref:Uncharacterized protein n=1 Tax=Teladorsagia circumcincta TaxID=45464 RepID=A0A2G9V7T8_TELCI|nr:hypothetical protein TELCIR_00009 [Teladorsagia circumcincta]